MSSKTPPTPTTPSTNFGGEPLINHTPTSTVAKHTDHSLQYRRKLTHLSTTLAPLLSITSGTAHPSFPSTILHYHLLTEDQLNELAHHYHQRTPSRFSLCYPLPVVGRWHHGTTGQGEAKLEDKRRRFGRFVGLRGCESPVDGDGDEANREREQRAMELYVEGEIKRREERAWAEMTGRGKGFW
ncbi:MAG: hypothetical protein LQ346_002569 [Caloplaca aetnensis]|nr:MAG: hypothetical protein LQ346_002569 [Caloplaca aetnensis]